LNTLEPGIGLMLKMSGDDQLIYPASTASMDEDIEVQESLVRDFNAPDWDVNVADYEFTGSVNASVHIDGERVGNEADMLATFVDGELRGVTSGIYFPLTQKYTFMLMTYSNEEGEELSFKYYNAESGNTYDLDGALTFEDNMIVGNAIDSYVMTNEELDIGNPGAFALNAAYPNPFNPSTTVDYTVSQSGNVNVSVYDINGRMVEELVNEYRSTDEYTITWNASAQPSGVYFITMISGEFTSTQKVMLLK